MINVARSERDRFGSVEWALFGAVGLIWGSSYLLIKIGLGVFHPGLITWARVALGALALVFPDPGGTSPDRSGGLGTDGLAR